MLLLWPYKSMKSFFAGNVGLIYLVVIPEIILSKDEIFCVFPFLTYTTSTKKLPRSGFSRPDSCSVTFCMGTKVEPEVQGESKYYRLRRIKVHGIW